MGTQPPTFPNKVALKSPLGIFRQALQDDNLLNGWGGRRLHLPCGPFALAPAGSRQTARGGGPAQPGAPRAAAAAAEPASSAPAGGGSSLRASSRAREEREGTPRTRSPAPARHSPPLNYLRRWPLRGSLLRVAPSRSPRREGEFLPVDVLFRNAKRSVTLTAAGRFPDSRGSEPAAGRFYLAWHSFHFISDEDVELSQKGHKSGQLALAPRRSSSNNFARASFAHSSTQVRNVTAHSVDGCETRRTQSPFDEIYMAHDASGLRFPGSPPPPAAPGRTSSEWQRAFGKLRGACKLKSEREGRRRERERIEPGKQQPSEGWPERFT
ncbi:uncharacterized protein LOC123952946 [Meles meles]|uniref:uncharacterized protein LOC123952946 n=1 Tax=Meles meles TaxID=9662 RepID=UPI001E69F8FC|nr:uncharacterized protein LOC123952946 [Meles meles]